VTTGGYDRTMTGFQAPLKTVVTPPAIPTSWTASTIVTYAGAFVLFLFGALAEAHVVVPASVPNDVALWSGVISQVAGAVTTLVTTITHASVVKASLKS
jgi:hypothetical protein